MVIKNKILTSIVASAILLTSLNAFDLEYRLDSLDKKVNKLSKEKVIFQKMKSSYLEDIEELETRLDELETSAALNSKMRFGLDFVANYNYFDVTLANGDNYQIDNLFRNRLDWNLYSEITDSMTFDGTLSMYKNWADNTQNFGASYDDTLGTRPNSNSIFFTRAYISWKKEIIEDVPMVLTFGRLPSTKGTSYDFQNNSVRQATFSSLDFDGTADGFIITTLLDKKTGLNNSSFRFAFGKGYQHDDGTPMTPSIPVKTTLEDTNVFGFFLESEIPTYKKSMLQFGYVKAFDMISDPTMGDLGAMFGFPANTPQENVGDLELYSVATVFKEINDSNWNVFAHYSMSRATPSGDAFGGALGLLSNGSDTTVKTGSAYWVGTRYDMDNGWKIGAEYNEGSKNWLSFTRGSENIYNKLSTRGSAFEAYFIVPISRYAFFKFGYLNIDYKYTGSSFHLGAPRLIEDLSAIEKANTVDTLDTYYFNLEVRF